jgi:hypothetical protein
VVSSFLGVGVGGISPNSGGAGVGGSSRPMWSGGGAPGSPPSLKQLYYINIWWQMPLFLDIYFIFRYRYNMEVDEEKIDTYNISVGFAYGFGG